MTKKEFRELCDYHKYTGSGRENNVSAIFFDRNHNGNKYCVYSRTTVAGKEALINELWDFVTGKINDTVWYIQLVVAQTDEQRFKVPISSGGLRCLIRYKS